MQFSLPYSIATKEFPNNLQNEKIKSFIGWDGVVVFDEDTDILDMLKNYAYQYQCYSEACGRCTPGKYGGRVLYDLLHKIQNDPENLLENIDQLERTAHLMQNASKCEIGKTTPKPILQMLQTRREIFLNPKKIANNQKYISKITAPCTDACPSHVNIPAYIEGVRDMLFADSLSATRSSMPLAQVCGRVCPHPCENACRRSILDEPISIMELKRIGADYEFDMHLSYQHSKTPAQSPSTQKKVAVIGAGPGGLSSAYYLAIEGIGVDVYEALPVLGGEVAVGVPNYRMPISHYNHDIDMLKDLGVRFHTSSAMDETSMLELEKSHQAIVLATGARISKKLGFPGEDSSLDGYLPAIKFMDEVNLAQKFNLCEFPDITGKNIICVGGGFTSMDVVRSAIRLGAKSVTMLYRRDEATIIRNTSKEEYHESVEEGVKFEFLSAVVDIVSKDGKIIAVDIGQFELKKTPDSPKGELVKIDKPPLRLECDILIPAVSQVPDFSYLPKEWGIEITKWGTLQTQEGTFSTNRKGVFGCGDCVSGPLTIVNAVGQGRRVASVIKRYLENGEISLNDEEKMEDYLHQIGVFNKNEMVKGWNEGLKRSESKKVSPSERKNSFVEVNFGLSNQEAFSEAQRCMRCYYIAMAVL
ncbi:FAD-dependent oxidoreductase [Helicobacter cappadocius]|uniref:FAD-dependent oxidoreductase n=1 Tax=Helicobacter cappadocius TaxID=3063998 RepID=A0AA90PLY9_9HELI|nr:MULTISPECIES: FAD-dependent oxidoreductase [unclassified Helicobacter]MDO7253708.1 FAD-dependent oxidoreductase [Helicobacter sp. faydin-H75]MDP2539604.1 FAD-dependent oxidoreductase [Helicobacter sp. faydin-H76]